MKKVVALLLAALMMTFAFVACEDAAPEAPVSEQDVIEPSATESVIIDPVAAEPESNEPEETETEPEETEPAATEPVETEPEETEPAATEPAATEPAATEPVETEPAATEPEETEPAEIEPVETDPVVTEPAATEPAETEPVETEPKKEKARTPAWLLAILSKLNKKETWPVETEPVETEPAETEPAETEPVETEPAETEPAETEPAETEPAETEPAETEPAETEPPVTEPEIDISDLYDNSDGTDTYDRVIIIGVDGGGAFFKDTDTPNLDAIFERGAVTYTMQTSTPSISAQSWGALMHGVTPEIHRLTNDIVSNTPFDPESPYPSFFRVVREAYSDATLASFCTWNPINIGIIENGLNVTKDTAGNDAALTDKILAYLDENDPTVLFIQFDDVDGAGHGNGYGSDTHLKQITTTDEYIGEIYKKLDEKGLLKNTLIIVTADHGGTMAGGHGGSTSEEMNIMFAVAGKTVVNGGTVISKDENGNADNAQIRDTAAVVLHAFGLTQPDTWSATVPGDTFVGVDAVTRPETKIAFEHDHRTHESVPTPAADSGNYITDVLGADRVKAYLTFDNTIADAMGNATSMKEDGKIYYVDGYYGAGAQLSETYVELENIKPGKDSFTVAMWVKTGGENSDPCLISNKNWLNGTNPGFVLSLREHDVKFNVGDGTNRLDSEWQLPVDYRNGWMHIVFTVNRATNRTYLSYDFGELVEKTIYDSLADDPFDGISGLVIGQDGTKNYGENLNAILDDVIIIDGTVTADDVAALAEYYGIEK